MKFYNASGQELSNVSLSLQHKEGSALKPGHGDRSITFGKPQAFTCKAMPSPFVSEIGFEIELKSPDFVEVELYDISGNLIKSLKEQLPAGSSFITISDLENIAGGVYLYKVRSGAEIANGKLLKL
mgnify:CR=1 FL=1